jgi:AcrR family transcriptional regulator
VRNGSPKSRNPRPRPSAARASRDSLAGRAVERALSGRRELYEDEVQRLVEAAFALIEKTGDLEPRVSDIVREAGLSNQAFYRHFPTKHALLVAVLDAGVRMLASYLAHRMAQVPGGAAQVREWMRGMLAQALDPTAAAATRPFALARTRLAEAYPAEVAASEAQLTALVRDAIRAGVESGELPHADPERDAETLYHQAMGWLQARLSEPSTPDRAAAERLVEFALHGLLRGAALPASAEGARSDAKPSEDRTGSART